MGNVTIHDIEQGSEAWHELRAGKYTGANAHKLLRYGAIDFSLTQATSFNGSFWTKRGHLLEDECIELYETITRTHVNRPGFVTNDAYEDCGFSPDGLTADRLIEVKCFAEAKHRRLYNGDIPLEVKAQIHFGLLITELKQASLLIYNPELDPKLAFKVIDIPYNQNIQNNFKRILGKEFVHV